MPAISPHGRTSELGRARPLCCARSSRSTSAPASLSGETVAERTELGVSSATIRNELAALEELGYLTHPHTSAGRIPTDTGYRLYVDTLPAGGRLHDTQRREIASHFAEVILDLEEVLKGSVHLLSRLTQYAGLAVPPGASDEQIVRLEVVDMGPTLLVLVVGQHGRVDKQIVDRPEHIETRALSSSRARLQRHPRARRTRRAGQAPADRGRRRPRSARLFADRRRGAACRDQGERGGHVIVGGVANLADETQEWRRETLRRLVETLEREQEMLRVLQDVAPAEDVRVTIGEGAPLHRRVGRVDRDRAVQGGRCDGRDDRHRRADADGLPLRDGGRPRGREAAVRLPRTRRKTVAPVAICTRCSASAASDRRRHRKAYRRSRASTTPT